MFVVRAYLCISRHTFLFCVLMHFPSGPFFVFCVRISGGPGMSPIPGQVDGGGRFPTAVVPIVGLSLLFGGPCIGMFPS